MGCNLLMHQRRCSGSQGVSGNVKCHKCLMNFINGNELKDHLKNSHSDISSKPGQGQKTVVLKCPVKKCPLEFTTQDELKDHFGFNHIDKEQEPSNRKWVKCPQCLLLFRNKFELKGHLINAHGVKLLSTSDKLYPCGTCSKAYNNPLDYENHSCPDPLNSASDPTTIEKHVYCDNCALPFVSQQGLRIHRQNSKKCTK